MARRRMGRGRREREEFVIILEMKVRNVGISEMV